LNVDPGVGVPRGGAPLRIALMGAGRIGRKLMRRVAGDARFEVAAISDTSGTILKEPRFTGADLTEVALFKEARGRLSELPGEHERCSDPVEGLRRAGAGVLVDVTAAQTYPVLQEALEDAHVVAANKIPFADVSYERYVALLAKARELGRALEYGTTAGAGLRVPDLLRSLGSCGVDGFSGCLSGTMNYVSQRLNDGTSLSEAVREAMGPPRFYAEPDPRVDLGGGDFARKLVILARMCLRPVECGDVEVEALVREEHAGLPVKEFVEALPEYDEEMRRRVDKARGAGEAYWFLGTADIADDVYCIGFKGVPLGEPIAKSRESDNVLVIHPSRWRRPVTLMGPGAGPPETVTGLIAGLSSIYYS